MLYMKRPRDFMGQLRTGPWVQIFVLACLKDRRPGGTVNHHKAMKSLMEVTAFCRQWVQTWLREINKTSADPMLTFRGRMSKKVCIRNRGQWTRKQLELKQIVPRQCFLCLFFYGILSTAEIMQYWRTMKKRYAERKEEGAYLQASKRQLTIIRLTPLQTRFWQSHNSR